jgi:hypothetical protein
VSAAARCFDPAHRSFSADRGFDECQWRDARYRLDGIPRKASPAMVVGLVVDEATCQILHGGDTPNVPAMVATQADAEGIIPAAVEEMTEKAVGLTDLWVREVWPTKGRIYSTQHELHWEYEGIVYHAHLDEVWSDGAVDDLKTSGRRLEERRADTDDQLTYYAWGMWAVYGIVVPRVGLDGLIWANPPSDVKLWRPDARKPWHDRQESTRTLEQIRGLADRAAFRDGVRQWADANGTHLPNGRSVAFACKDCAVKAACPAWVGFDTEEIIDVAA